MKTADLLSSPAAQVRVSGWKWVAVDWLALCKQDRSCEKPRKPFTPSPFRICVRRAFNVFRFRVFFFFLEVENLQTLEHKGPKWRLANGIPPGVFVAKRKREHEQVPFLFGRYDF